MGDEHGIIVVKITITQTGTGHGYRSIVAQELQNAFVAGQLTTRSQGERFKHRLCTDLAKDMREHVTLIAVLHPDVVEAASIGDVNFQNNIGPRPILPRFNQGNLCTRGHFDHMMDGGIALAEGGGVDMNGGRDGTRYIDKQPIPRNSCVHSRQTPLNRFLSCRLQMPVNIPSPMQV